MYAHKSSQRQRSSRNDDHEPSSSQSFEDEDVIQHVQPSIVCGAAAAEGLWGAAGNAVGNATAREEYYPYGENACVDEEAEEIHDRTQRYSGKERDATGLLYYQPDAGRWQSADPGGLVDGVNHFRFRRDNPLNTMDKDGRVPAPPPVPERPEESLRGRGLLPPVPTRPAATLSPGSQPPVVPERPLSSLRLQTPASTVAAGSVTTRQGVSAAPAEKVSAAVADVPQPFILDEYSPPDAQTLAKAPLFKDLSSRYDTLLVRVNDQLVIHKNMGSMFITADKEKIRQEVAARNEVFAWKFSNALKLNLVPVTALASGADREVVSQYIPNQPLRNFNRPDTSMHVFDFLINARDRGNEGGNVLMDLQGNFKAIDHESILEPEFTAIAPECVTQESINLFFRNPETRLAFQGTDWSSFFDEHTHPGMERRELAREQFLGRVNWIKNRIHN